MSQVNSFSVPNGYATAVRSGFNAALAALATSNSGPTAPVASDPGMFWFDTSQPGGKLWQRNIDNTAWASINLDGVRVDNLATAQLLKVYEVTDAASYTRSTTSNGVFGPSLTITPAHAESFFVVNITMSVSLQQTGSDDDIRALVSAAFRQADGSYSPIVTGGVNFGVNNLAAPGVTWGHVSFQTVTSARHNGALLLRGYGGIGSDADSGYSATLSILHTRAVVMEYLQ